MDGWMQVRREKISERMKYLQELVPGCSKVCSSDTCVVNHEDLTSTVLKYDKKKL